MSNFDNDLRDELRKADGPVRVAVDREETLREMIARSFRGKLRWMSVVAWVYMMAFSGLAILAAVAFFTADRDRTFEHILYATVFLTACMFVTAVKMWYWTILNRNTLHREIKRLELRIAELAERQGE